MDVHAPHTLDEALRLRGEQPGARPIAGGTDLMVALNAERARPDALIDLGRVEELRGWHREGDELVLGAAVTYTQAAGGELVSELPALAAASRTVDRRRSATAARSVAISARPRLRATHCRRC